RTRGAAYRRNCASASSTNSSARLPRAQRVWEGRGGWEWDWPSRAASSKRTAGASGGRAGPPGSARAAPSPYPSVTKRLMKGWNAMNQSQRILVVDDEVQIARVLRRSLAARGYEVQVAGEGEEALEIFNAWAPDLVITDL